MIRPRLFYEIDADLAGEEYDPLAEAAGDAAVAAYMAKNTSGIPETTQTPRESIHRLNMGSTSILGKDLGHVD